MSQIIDIASVPSPAQLVADIRAVGADGCAGYPDRWGWTAAHAQAVLNAGLQFLPVIESDYRGAAQVISELHNSWRLPSGPVALGYESGSTYSDAQLASWRDNLHAQGWQAVGYGNANVFLRRLGELREDDPDLDRRLVRLKTLAPHEAFQATVRALVETLLGGRFAGFDFKWVAAWPWPIRTGLDRSFNPASIGANAWQYTDQIGVGGRTYDASTFNFALMGGSVAPPAPPPPPPLLAQGGSMKVTFRTGDIGRHDNCWIEEDPVKGGVYVRSSNKSISGDAGRDETGTKPDNSSPPGVANEGNPGVSFVPGSEWIVWDNSNPSGWILGGATDVKGQPWMFWGNLQNCNISGWQKFVGTAREALPVVAPPVDPAAVKAAVDAEFVSQLASGAVQAAVDAEFKAQMASGVADALTAALKVAQPGIEADVETKVKADALAAIKTALGL